MTKDEYIALITSEHADKVKFIGVVGASVEAFSGAQAALRSLLAACDIDTAVGVQLDSIGRWVGISRRLKVPLVGLYFAWDGAISDGFDSGIWQGEHDPASGLVNLPDEAYRTLLRAKIAANAWDGSVPSAYAIWAAAFNAATYLIIQDNQNMSMTIGISGAQLSAVDKALLIGGYLPLKPAGVKVNYYAVAPAAGSLFAWDVAEGAVMAGFDNGQWATELTPA